MHQQHRTAVYSVRHGHGHAHGHGRAMLIDMRRHVLYNRNTWSSKGHSAARARIGRNRAKLRRGAPELATQTWYG